MTAEKAKNNKVNLSFFPRWGTAKPKLSGKRPLSTVKQLVYDTTENALCQEKFLKLVFRSSVANLVGIDANAGAHC